MQPNITTESNFTLLNNNPVDLVHYLCLTQKILIRHLNMAEIQLRKN